MSPASLPPCARLVRRATGHAPTPFTRAYQQAPCGRTSEYTITDPTTGALLAWACHRHRTYVTDVAPAGAVLVDHRHGEERVPARLLHPGDRITVHNVSWTVEGVGEVFPGHPERLQVAYLHGPGRQFESDEPVWRSRVAAPVGA
jgi:hypothetical protein